MKEQKEWRKRNPCYRCEDQVPCESCSAGNGYRDVVETQRELLDFLIRNPDIKAPNSRASVYVSTLKTMRKQLEGK